jgi:hypothetical protein
VHFIRTSRHASAVVTAVILVVIGVVVGVTRHDPGQHGGGVELRADQQSLQPSPTITVPSDVVGHTPTQGSEPGATPLTIGSLGGPIHAPSSGKGGRTTTGSGGNGGGNGTTNTTIGDGGGGTTNTTTGSGGGGGGSAFVPGRIAYSLGGAVWTINPDGSGARNVASPGFFPAWSPDHSAIAYADADGAGGGLHVVTASGDSGLTTGVVADSEPVWSPDGKKIAFGRIDNSQPVEKSEIWIVDRDGKNLRQLTHLTCPNGYNRDPSWSPDGKTIVFWSSNADCTHGNYSLYSVDVASGVATPFNPPVNTTSDGPAWSPDGKTIAFSSDGYGGVGFDICVMSPDGSGAHRITQLSGNEKDPAWSPDAKRLVIARSGGIYLMDKDGSDITSLVSGAIQPAWY